MAALEQLALVADLPAVKGVPKQVLQRGEAERLATGGSQAQARDVGEDGAERAASGDHLERFDEVGCLEDIDSEAAILQAGCVAERNAAGGQAAAHLGQHRLVGTPAQFAVVEGFDLIAMGFHAPILRGGWRGARPVARK